MKWVPLLPADYKSWTDGEEGKEVLINYYYIEDPAPGEKAAVLFLPKNRVEKGRRGRNPQQQDEIFSAFKLVLPRALPPEY